MSNLVQLANQVDEIDRLKHDYYHEVNAILEHFSGDQLLWKTGSFCAGAARNLRRRSKGKAGLVEDSMSSCQLLPISAGSAWTWASSGLNDVLAANEHSDNDDTIDAINQRGPPTASPTQVIERSTPVHSEQESYFVSRGYFWAAKIGNSDLVLWNSRLPVEDHWNHECLETFHGF